jgi:hypothetical protein
VSDFKSKKYFFAYSIHTMTSFPVKKYSVTYLDTVNHNVEILSVWTDPRDALKSMMDVIENNENYSNEAWVKIQLDDSHTVSVFACHYLSSKSLIARYFVIDFDDTC